MTELDCLPIARRRRPASASPLLTSPFAQIRFLRSDMLFLLVADEKLTGGQPLQRESQAQVIEHQALEFAGQ